jgi:hypothetical protein
MYYNHIRLLVCSAVNFYNCSIVTHPGSPSMITSHNLSIVKLCKVEIRGPFLT